MPKRQCWECFRRRLVCDSSLPFCKKCSAAGKSCPGYGAKEPLKWLVPSTTRRLTQRQQRSTTGNRWLYTTATEKPTEKAKIHEGHNQLLKIDASLGEIKPDDSAIVEAALYYNSEWYPEYATMQQSSPNPYLAPFPLEVLHLLPISLRHSLACLVFTHRARRTSPKADYFEFKIPSRIFYHRGLAIKALSDDIGNVNTGSNEVVIASILIFLISEIRLFPSTWQHNFHGATELVKLQGGFEHLSRSSVSLQPSLLCLLIIGVVANTTSPTSNNILVASEPGTIDLVADMYGDGLCPGLPCPSYLFLDIMRINQLRLPTTRVAMDESAQPSALALLQHIESFCSEEWAESKSSAYDQWFLIGTIYQSAVALYCISSLESTSVLQETSELKQNKAAHQRRLFTLLQEAFLTSHLKNCMMWPLVVAGMHATDASPETRRSIDKQLEEISWELGTPAPLVARAVFKQFWVSKETTWDSCFDTSYCFLF